MSLWQKEAMRLCSVQTTSLTSARSPILQAAVQDAKVKRPLDLAQRAFSLLSAFVNNASAVNDRPSSVLPVAMSAPTISAAQAVGEYLQSPDDLAKVAAFRKKLEKEKASIDARLRSGVKEQLDATREGLRKLFGTRSNVQTIKDEMETVDRMCSDPQYVVSTFDQIRNVRASPELLRIYAELYVCYLFKVSEVHRNFEQTEEMVNNLLEMNSKLEMIEQMLLEDRNDILGPAFNLLRIHFALNRLEAFRNQTMHQAKKSSADTRNTLTRWFERLTNLLELFDGYVLDLARNILPIVRAGNPDVIVRLMKVVEMEAREDEKVCIVCVCVSVTASASTRTFRYMLLSLSA